MTAKHRRKKQKAKAATVKAATVKTASAGAAAGRARPQLQVSALLKPITAPAAACYALAAAACLVVTFLVLQLWQADLSVPFAYKGDGLVSSVWVKGIIDNGWYLFNDYVGAPWGMAMGDFPTSDNLHFLLIKFISLFTGNYAVVLNLFFLATYPLITISSLFVFRRLNISYPAAILGSLIFTFLPYHLYRGEEHLFLGALYVVPLSALLILRVGYGEPPFVRLNQSGREMVEVLSLRTAGYALIAVLTASAGIYYAFFACFFLVIMGGYAAYSQRSIQRLLSAGIAIGIIAVMILVNLLPTFAYHNENGPNDLAAKRYAIESEIFGMTISQLILPIANHRIGFLSYPREVIHEGAVYTHETAVFENENSSSALGLIGSAGLIFSLGWLIFGRRKSGEAGGEDRSLLDNLGVLNVSGVLFATIGGFSLIFAVLVSPGIRAYARISPFIGFFSILVMLLLLERLRRKYFSKGRNVLALGAMVAVVAVLGILDQSEGSMAPSYNSNARQYASDAAFIRKIENAMPARAQIFQLPYMCFPENGPVNKMLDYDHFRAYLHSSSLKWSYGVMKGRPGDDWDRRIVTEPTRQLIKDLASAGFSGVYINRAAYQDGAAKLEQELESALAEKPLTNDDNTLLFFDISKSR